MNGTLKIADLDLARVTQPNNEGPTGIARGTIRYMAPESLDTTIPHVVHMDIWVWAIIALEMITGQLPYPWLPNTNDLTIQNLLIWIPSAQDVKAILDYIINNEEPDNF